MNILIINHYAGNRNLGMVYRYYYLGKEWVKCGNKVMIIGGSYSHYRSQQPTTDKETMDGIEFRWIPVSTYKGSGLGRVKSMTDFVRKLWFGYKKYLGNFKPDIVISSTPNNFEIYPAKRIATHYGAKLIYEVRDIWPLTPMELGGYSKYHPLMMMMQAAEDYCYKHADKVVSLLPNALDHMVERGMDPKKFVYIPNGFDPAEWSGILASSEEVVTQRRLIEETDEKTINQLKQLRVDGHFLVGFTGAHGLANSLYAVIDAVSDIKDGDIRLVLVGSGTEKNNLIRYVKDRNISNVIFFPPVAKASIPYVLDLMDCLYIGLQKQPLFRFGISPNKMFDYMMAAKPVIQAIEAGNNMVQEAGNGIFVEPDNPEKIREAVVKIKSMSSDQREVMGIAGRDFALKYHAYPVLAKQFLEALN